MAKVKVVKVTEGKLPKLVRDIVNEAISSSSAHPIGWKEEWVREQSPTFEDPHYTRIYFYGCNRFRYAYARYEGPYGKWMVSLLPDFGVSWQEEEARKIHPAERASRSAASCLEPSNEWCESGDERRARIAAWCEQGVNLCLMPTERVSWKKIG
jgi:hypothetical protein